MSQALSSPMLSSSLLAETKSGAGWRPERSVGSFCRWQVYAIMSFNFPAPLSIAQDKANEMVNPQHSLVNRSCVVLYL